MSIIAEYFHVFTALLVVVDPIGAVPLFITVTGGNTPSDRVVTARTAAIAVAIVLVQSIFLGEAILKLFGVGIPAFRVGGGILIMLMAISMLNAKPGGTRQTTEEIEEAENRHSVGVVPLAIPMLAGPGAISTTIIYAQKAHTLLDYCALTVTVLLVAACVAVALYSAGPIARRMGHIGINITTRIMGLMVAAVAVEFIAGGLTQLFPKLA
jgi:multiple antibiotic resistance protein